MNWIRESITNSTKGWNLQKVLIDLAENTGEGGRWTERARQMLTNYVPAGAEEAEEFALWLAMADVRCQKVVGVGIFDLEDYGWRDAFDNGTRPSGAVRDALMNDDLYRSLFEGE